MRTFFTRRPGPVSFIFLGSTVIVLLVLIPLTSMFVVSNMASHSTTRPEQNIHIQPTSNIGAQKANIVPQATTSPTTNVTPSLNSTPLATSTSRVVSTTHGPASQATQPTATIPAPQSQPGKSSLQFSFEDGLIDNWQTAGPVIIQNSTDHAEDGNHALKASFTALAASNYPYISVPSGNIPNPYPKVGQTLKAYVYIPIGSPSTSVWWFVADSNNTWHKGTQQSLTSGIWNQVTFAMPSINASPNQMGLQFATGSGGTAYIDAISWN